MTQPITLLFRLVGIGFLVAGFDKVVGLKPYRRLARHWAWREQDMRTLGAAEMAGGVLLAMPATRRLGGAVLTAASAAALVAEAQHGDTALALPRLGLLGTALLATVAPGV
jgi:uncharacterized membrane protein